MKCSEKSYLQVLVFPKDLNNHGTLFGGTMLGWLDNAGAILATEKCHERVMLVSVNEATFKKPSFNGDKLEFFAKIEKIGRTSIVTYIEAWRYNFDAPKGELVTTATITYVAVDEHRKPTKITVQN